MASCRGYGGFVHMSELAHVGVVCSAQEVRGAKLVWPGLRFKSWAKGTLLINDVDDFASLSERCWCRDVVVDMSVFFLET